MTQTIFFMSMSLQFVLLSFELYLVFFYFIIFILSLMMCRCGQSILFCSFVIFHLLFFFFFGVLFAYILLCF
jgi:hypothetical protein